MGGRLFYLFELSFDLYGPGCRGDMALQYVMCCMCLLSNCPVSVGFVILTAVVMKSSVFWDIAPCGPFRVIPRFGGTCPFHQNYTALYPRRQNNSISHFNLRAYLFLFVYSRILCFVFLLSLSSYLYSILSKYFSATLR
jgi:hypothetical protein